MVSTLARNAKDVGSNTILETLFSIFIIRRSPVAMTMILYKVHIVWLLNLPCVCICTVTACMYVILSINNDTSSLQIQ